MFFTEQYTEYCIPSAGQSYHSFRWFRNTGRREACTLQAKNQYSRRLPAVGGRKRPVNRLTESKKDDESLHGRLGYSAVCSCSLENTGIRLQESQSSMNVSFHRNRNDRILGTLRSIWSTETLVCFSNRWNLLRKNDRGMDGYSLTGGPMHAWRYSKRTMISSSVQAGMDSFDGLSFASEEGSYNSATKFVESLKTLLLTSGDVLPLINMVFNNSTWFRAFADPAWVQ